MAESNKPERQTIVELKDLWKSYYPGKVRLDALKGINLKLIQGDFIAVAGPSGSGKTTLMNIIGLIDKPTSGSIIIEGEEADHWTREKQTQMRHEAIGFIFQSFNLLPVLTVFENIELPLLLGKNKGSKVSRKERVEALLEEVGLADRRNHLPAELSGGQQQRAAIARALVMRPKIVIADEPTANLDSQNGERVLSLMKKVNAEDNTTFVFSTHDSVIWGMAQHVIFLHDGDIKSETKKSV
ncbi:MAG: ABC transporter ATP-binding protein [Spirochaetaceae bacterium]|jgi:putative ABC transport system ATP-binding protein|nr:ABC transporter ATP-binding protein [Spirochaetaceae bacterium]